MKKLTVLVLVFLGSIQVFASDNIPTSLEQQLRNEVATLLENPQILVEKELSADIEFTLNTKGEIVVLLIESNEELVESYVKSRLNYKKIDSNLSKSENRVYKLTLKIKKPRNA